MQTIPEVRVEGVSAVRGRGVQAYTTSRGAATTWKEGMIQDSVVVRGQISDEAVRVRVSKRSGKEA